MFIVPCIADLY